ncbi:putative beta-lactamase [Scytonema sp. HK-05]|uniref:class A beta-lactamase n=1 Tax=Scytonema sp. HK-05 TaxID=1137095 RepID=UPI000935D38E|nr:class A beta-lactamase [Scytonema sp. HK-05]OKH53668.1 serine hydrolase [Scytonema sp. HK-05]BAY49673.1 putative beta-lactamase [Scytonema sp. HK-05]
MFSVFVRRFCLSFGVVILLSLMLLPVKAQQPSLTSSSPSIAESSLQQQQIHQTAPLAGGMMKVSAQLTPAQSNTRLFQERLKNLDVSAAQGKVGIGVLDLNSGQSWFLNGKQRFPMQSVYKLPSGIAVLKQVDEGKISLKQLVTIMRQDFAPGSSPMIKEFKGDRVQIPLRNVLESSVGISDNTAADALVRLLGGTKQVNAILSKLQIRNIRVDRLEQQMQPESVGLKNFQPELADEQKYKEAVEKIPDSVKKAALQKYLTDPRDTATPEAMVDLLAKLNSNQLLSENSTALLLKIMTDSPTGQKRLKAGLPENWSIAHKTGTGADVLGIGTATNDVGIVSSPDGKRVAIAVFIAGSKAPLEEREKVMSNIASRVVQAMQ